MKRSMLLLLLLAGCSKGQPPNPSWGSMKILSSPTATLEAYRIGDRGKGGFEDWPVTAGPVAIDAPTAKRLTDLLLDPKSYSDNPKPCEPLPGVKLRWLDGGRKVDAIFCFECSTLWFYSAEKARDQREFDPIEKPLAAIMKKIFSADPAIQSLK